MWASHDLSSPLSEKPETPIVPLPISDAVTVLSSSEKLVTDTGDNVILSLYSVNVYLVFEFFAKLRLLSAWQFIVFVSPVVGQLGMLTVNVKAAS